MTNSQDYVDLKLNCVDVCQMLQEIEGETIG
jgi:hypothetical protein